MSNGLAFAQGMAATTLTMKNVKDSTRRRNEETQKLCEKDRERQQYHWEKSQPAQGRQLKENYKSQLSDTLMLIIILIEILEPSSRTKLTRTSITTISNCTTPSRMSSLNRWSCRLHGTACFLFGQSFQFGSIFLGILCVCERFTVYMCVYVYVVLPRLNWPEFSFLKERMLERKKTSIKLINHFERID